MYECPKCKSDDVDEGIDTHVCMTCGCEFITPGIDEPNFILVQDEQRRTVDVVFEYDLSDYIRSRIANWADLEELLMRPMNKKTMDAISYKIRSQMRRMGITKVLGQWCERV